MDLFETVITCILTFYWTFKCFNNSKRIEKLEKHVEILRDEYTDEIDKLHGKIDVLKLDLIELTSHYDSDKESIKRIRSEYLVLIAKIDAVLFKIESKS